MVMKSEDWWISGCRDRCYLSAAPCTGVCETFRPSSCIVVCSEVEPMILGSFLGPFIRLKNDDEI